MVAVKARQKGQPGGKEVVHELMMSAEAMAILAEAIRALTVQKLKFQRLKDVIVEALVDTDLTAGEATQILERHLPLDGQVRIYLRVNASLNAELDALKTNLCDRLEGPCGVRETVIFCALVVAAR